jgi:hypothetical protein
MSSIDFENAFYHLSHHLFPDGCPEPSLAAVWPPPRIPRRRTDPRVTSSSEALGSVRLLKDYAVRYGLSMAEVSAVACACHRMATATDLASVLVRNKHHFSAVIKCILPKRHHSISREAVSQLLSIPSTEERILVIRFLTLAVQTGEWLAPDALKFFTGTYAYSIIFQAALHLTSCCDAVRLLLRLTCDKHATKHRMRRVELIMTRHGEKVKPLSALLGLMQSLHLDATASYVPTVGDEALPAFTDKDWEQDFARGIVREPVVKKLPSMLRSSLSKPLAYSGRLVDLLLNPELQHLVLLSSTERTRLRSVLSTHLLAEWFDEQSNDRAHVNSVTRSQSRVELLTALSCFVRKTGWMPLEAEEFVINVLLSNWDGTCKPYGEILCRDLLPYVTQQSSPSLRMLESHVVHGEETCQMLILTALSDLLSQRSRTAPTSLHKYVNSVEILLMKACSMQQRRNDLLMLAAIDFQEALSDAGLASTAILAMLLRSPSPIVIDRMCGWAASLGPTQRANLCEFAAGFLDSFASTSSRHTSSRLFRGKGPVSREAELFRTAGFVCGMELTGYTTVQLQEHRSDDQASWQESSEEKLKLMQSLQRCGFMGAHSFLLPL